MSNDPATIDDATLLPAAAILYDEGTDVDALLARLAARQREAGRHVRGLLMTWPAGRTRCAGPMVLVDIATQAAYKVSQDLGADATGCRADTQGFARASRVLREALGAAPDLVVCNRFGTLEAEGGGFGAELLDIMASGVPLLTAVAPRHLAAWQRFTGGATVLPAEAAAVEAWLAGVLTAPAPRA